MINNNFKLTWHITYVFLISSLLLSSCAGATAGKLPAKAYITATNDAEIPDSQQSATQDSAEIPVNLLGENVSLNNYSLAIPKGWFLSEVNRPNMHGWIFTMRDPITIEENGFIEWAGAFWGLTPLPPGNNAEEFTSSLQNQNFNSSDFFALLLAPEQAGLLDLTDADASLKNVEITSWGGQPCLKMEGTVSFTGADNLSLDTQVILMANNQDFISYYQFSNSSVSTQINPLFTASFESFSINQ